MKKIAYILVVAFSLSLMACNKSDDALVSVIEYKNASLEEEVKENTVAEKVTLTPVGAPTSNSHKWEGKFTLGNQSKCTDQTVEFSLSSSSIISSAKTDDDAKYEGEKYILPNSQNTTYGEWYEDAQENKLRKVTMTVEVRTSEFTKTLKLTRRDAVCIIDGEKHSFASHNMSATFKSLDLTDEIHVIRNDSVYEQKTYSLKFEATFVADGSSKNYELESSHTVERFLHIKEADEEMPLGLHFVEPIYEEVCMDPVNDDDY